MKKEKEIDEKKERNAESIILYYGIVNTIIRRRILFLVILCYMASILYTIYVLYTIQDMSIGHLYR